MRLARQHVEGTSSHDLSKALGRNVEYKPVCFWPDDCMVQWGNGIIPATPFFEAFPTGTFIRGEGETIEMAERRAFAQYQCEFGCRHLWGRTRYTKHGPRPYTNSAGFCRHCGAFRSKMFKPIIKLGDWREPLSWMDAEYLETVLTNADGMNEHMDAKYPDEKPSRDKHIRKLALRKAIFGASTPPHQDKPNG